MRFLLATLFLMLSAGLGASEKPNFLIIFIDDMGYGDLSCYGNQQAATPRIDQLAKEGTRFTNFYAQTVCGPSRGALMTGRHPHRIGSGWTTNADEVFISEILQEAGYTTGCVGKWDMSRRRYQEALVPNSQGYDFFYGALGANDGNKVDLWDNRKSLGRSDDMAGLTKLFTDKSIEFLEKNQEKPFFLYLAHTMMHVVIDATPEYRDRTGNGLYMDTLEELDTETGRLLDKLEELGLSENTVVLFTSDNGPWSNDVKRQHAKNARFVEWTEGPETAWGGSGPLRGAKGETWEGGMRVPGIIRWPAKMESEQTSDAIVSTLDILPTFAALAGASSKVPTDRPIDGFDQSELLQANSEHAGARDHLFYFESYELQAVRKDEWKLRLPGLKTIRNWPEIDRGSNEIELYHLGKDIGETTNVAADHPEKVKELLSMANQAKTEIVKPPAEPKKNKTAQQKKPKAQAKAPAK